jgi:cyclopropane fatty-acyl-phospholipid synthase-like methyltransferase
MKDSFDSNHFPRSSQYHPDWIASNVSGGANPLWLTEWLTKDMNLKPGMRVLDLGCGRAASSIFLQREFGVEVWAVDLLVSATENFQRIRDAGAEKHIFPLNADARDLPFAAQFFDVIISIDSFFYYGTDDLYLSSILRFLKPGGYIAIAGAGTVVELNGVVPMHLQKWWTPGFMVPCIPPIGGNNNGPAQALSTFWVADTMDEGWRRWIEWHLSVAPDNKVEIEAVQEDAGRYLGYVRAIACRKKEVMIDEVITFIPYHYVQRPLLRG